jgi:hypothetical protein
VARSNGKSAMSLSRRLTNRRTAIALALAQEPEGVGRHLVAARCSPWFPCQMRRRQNMPGESALGPMQSPIREGIWFTWQPSCSSSFPAEGPALPGNPSPAQDGSGDHPISAGLVFGPGLC